MKRAQGIDGFPPVPGTVFLLFSLFGPILPGANAQNHQEPWDLRNEKDAMTGESSFFAYLETWLDETPLDRKSHAEVRVTCEPSELKVDIRYSADSDPDLGFRLVQGSPSVIFGQVYTPRPVVSLRVGIDKHVDILQAPVSFTNIVSFPFHGVQSSYDAIIHAPRSTPFARSEAQA